MPPVILLRFWYWSPVFSDVLHLSPDSVAVPFFHPQMLLKM